MSKVQPTAKPGWLVPSRNLLISIIYPYGLNSNKHHDTLRYNVSFLVEIRGELLILFKIAIIKTHISTVLPIVLFENICYNLTYKTKPQYTVIVFQI